MFAPENVLEIKRFVRAFDNFGGAIVTTDSLDQCIVRLARALGDKNVTGPPQVARRFAQCTARKQEFISERGLSIYQNNVEPMFEMQILQTVIEQKRVGLPFIDRELAAFHAVLVHEHDHILQIMREHVWLVPGRERIEQQRFPIGNNPRRIDTFV